MSWVRDRTKEAQIALMLLTRLHLGRVEDPVPGISRSAWAFPLAAIPVAAICWIAAGIGTLMGLPALTIGLLALGAATFVTGALHEDGLADVADGFGGGRTPESKLEIMRDSRIGSYGVIALVVVLPLKATAIGALAATPHLLAALLAAGALSRAGMTWALACLPPAREDGLGHAAARPDITRVLAGTGLALVATLPLALGNPPMAAAALLAILIGTASVAALALRQIGGQTGDVQGAIQLTSETAALLAITTLL